MQRRAFLQTAATLAVSAGSAAAVAPEFVQNTAGKCWLDLAEFELGLPAAVQKLRK